MKKRPVKHSAQQMKLGMTRFCKSPQKHQKNIAIPKDCNIFAVLKHNNMRTLNIAISDIEYCKFGIPGEQLNFTDFIDIIGRELMRQNLNRSVALAEKYGLSSMTMDDITNEVKAVRRNAKGNH